MACDQRAINNRSGGTTRWYVEFWDRCLAFPQDDLSVVADDWHDLPLIRE